MSLYYLFDKKVIYEMRIDVVSQSVGRPLDGLVILRLAACIRREGDG